MSKMTFAALAAASSLILATSAASALEVSGGGGRIGFTDSDAGDGGISVGAHVEMESRGSHWHFQPNILYWDGDPLTGFNGNLDAFYHFGPQARTSPYLGGGLGVDMVDFPGNGGSETDLGINLFGGVMFPAGKNNLFLEGRHTLSDVDQTSIHFGITLR